MTTRLSVLFVAMRFSIFFILMSAAQSFVTRRLVVVSHPFSKVSTSSLSKQKLHLLSPSSSSPSSSSSSSQVWKRSIAALSFLTPLSKSKTHAAGASATRTTSTTALSAAELLAPENSTQILSNDNEDATLTSTSIPKSTTKTEILADEKDFIKPDRDRHEYRWIKLPNNLQVLLVSTAKATTTASDDADDEDDDKSSAKTEAASVHVQAGHFDDTIPGLAHFHEHMLFLGTEKYPDEDDYERFLSKYGGFANAYTDMEDTNYYFSVTSQQGDPNQTSEGLSGGLDRLAQFFIAPTFVEGMVDRELKAIDSEYRNAKTSDSWRNFQFMKSISNQNHPFSNFGCGNYETLTSKGSPVGELKKFWETYYKTCNMRLAVVGQSTLDALQETVEQTFGTLPYSDAPPRRLKTNPDSPIFPRENAVYDPKNPAFGKEQLGKIREIIPLLESRSIKLQFATPPLDDPVLRRTRPHRVISHLLGHESPGSLHYILNSMGYVMGLTSGTSIDTSDFSLFSLTISLTPKGMKEKDKVLDLIFQWFAIIRKTVNEEPELMSKYHDELRQISRTNFKFQENGDPTDFCSAAANLMFDEIRPEEILISGVKCDDYDPVIAKTFMDRLRPDNCMIQITDSGLSKEGSEDEWKVEPLYGATYRESVITPEQMKSWETPQEFHPGLHVPALNEYIPTDFSLRCDDDHVMTEEEREIAKKENPVLLHQGPNFRMWHKMDSYWRVPKTFIRLSLVSPHTYESPRAMTLSRIYQRVLNDDLNSFVYDASIAGCNYRITCAPSGYKVAVRGYSEKLPILLDTLTTRMLSLIQELREGKDAHPELYARFVKAKENLLRETKNYRLDTPYEICNYNARLVLEENVWYLDNYVDEMEGPYAERYPLTMEECAEAAERSLTGRLKAEALCIGNIDKKGAVEVMDVIDQHFIKSSRPLNDAEAPKFKSQIMPTKNEAAAIFGDSVLDKPFPVRYQELAFSPSEENSAVEVTLQSGSDLSLGYEGIGIMDLISHMAYNSAYNQLRTKEQLGYIVSATTKKTAGGSWALMVVVQSSSASPTVLEERIESWLKTFREELEAMPAESIAMEARGVVAQLTEDHTKLSQEVGTVWNEISATQLCHESMTTPAFDRLDKLSDELILTTDDSSETTLNGNPRKTPEDLKKRILEFYDEFFAVDAPSRRTLSSRVFSQQCKEEFESTLKEPGVMSTYTDIRLLKDHLSTWPVAAYWRVK